MLSDDGKDGGDKWFRARVIEELEKGKAYRVRLVDYGSLEDVAADKLRELSNPSMSLSEVPAQAVRCRLAYVRCQELDDELGEEAAIQLHRLVWGKKLRATRAFGEGAADDGSGGSGKENVAREEAATPVSLWLGMAEGQDAGKDGDELSEKEAKRVAAAIRRGGKGGKGGKGSTTGEFFLFLLILIVLNYTAYPYLFNYTAYCTSIA